MNENKLKNVGVSFNEFMKEFMKDLKWHQRLRLRIQFKLDDIWNKFLINVVYRKYKC